VHFYIQDFLKCGSDHDHRAYAQFTHTKYLPGFTPPKKKPLMEQYEEDTERLMLKLSITYGTCQKFYYDYNIKFKDRKCDVCIKCHDLLNKLCDFPHDDPACNLLQKSCCGIKLKQNKEQICVKPKKKRQESQVDEHGHD